MTYRRRRERIYQVSVQQPAADGDPIRGAAAAGLRQAAPLFLRPRQPAMSAVKHGLVARQVTWQLSPTAHAACRLLDEVCGPWRFQRLGDPLRLIVTDVVQGRWRLYRDDGVADIVAGGQVTVALPEAPRHRQLSPTFGSATVGRPGTSR